MKQANLFYDLTFDEFIDLLKLIDEDDSEILMVRVTGQGRLKDLLFTINVKVL